MGGSEDDRGYIGFDTLYAGRVAEIR